MRFVAGGGGGGGVMCEVVGMVLWFVAGGGGGVMCEVLGSLWVWRGSGYCRWQVVGMVLWFVAGGGGGVMCEVVGMVLWFVAGGGGGVMCEVLGSLWVWRGSGCCRWQEVPLSLGAAGGPAIHKAKMMEAVKSKEHDSDGVAVTTVWAWW